MRGFAVEIAPITDPALRTAEVIDPALLDFVAVGDIDDISDAPQPPRGDVGVEAAPMPSRPSGRCHRQHPAGYPLLHAEEQEAIAYRGVGCRLGRRDRDDVDHHLR